MKKESQWFSHDSTASADPKLIALVSQYGMTGYGRWWRVLELLRAEDQYKYCITTKFAYSVLAKELMCSVDEAKQFINDCIEEYQLLETDGAHIWSNSLQNRMQHLDKKREVLSERGKKGAATTNAKRSAQAKPCDDTSAANNNTEQEIKQQEQKNKKTPLLLQGGDRPTSPEGDGSGVVAAENCDADDLENLKHKLLTDHIHFVHPLLASGKLTETQLSDWLTAFNRLLSFRGEKPKNEADYRKHFINWFKFRDPAKEDPKTFLLHNKSPVVIATNSFLKTPEQVEKEQEMRQFGNTTMRQ
jgi:hypothetical protein